MPRVDVQLWGSKPESLHIAYDWITVASIEYPSDKDLDFLKENVKKIVNESEYKPFMNACRIVFPSGARITMTDVW